ncbi:hypothetical protein SKL01_18570 [Staphylococcus kloosii]|uniref:Uncharacterized protein n=1 Tax=Staphylococcus kloosii TaxID=29384 RepID=A0ABQ0XQW1_9STAP|nr:hypothetical protein SKL01_18570 [Staphylococcus kloosii]
MGFLVAQTPLGGLAKQETGHPPVYSRPNDQATYNYGIYGLYRYARLTSCVFFCLNKNYE